MAEPRFDVTSLGEMLIRFSVPAGQRLETARQLDVYPAGAETNVLSLLARLGQRTCWVGALPRNPLGRLAEHALQQAGVSADGILWREDGRIGTYYVEFGAAPRGIQVYYDRANSCITQVKPDEVHWDDLLNSRLLHLTGITPALSTSCYELIREAFMHAKERRVPISFDVNYRQKLWTESRAREVLLPFLSQSDLVFCSARDATKVFGCTGSMEEIGDQLLEKIGSRTLVVSFADKGALLWNGAQWQHELAVPTQIFDRLGAGDALAAGVLHGWLQGDAVTGLRYGMLLAALALSQMGDMVITNEAELKALMSGNSSLLR